MSKVRSDPSETGRVSTLESVGDTLESWLLPLTPVISSHSFLIPLSSMVHFDNWVLTNAIDFWDFPVSLPWSHSPSTLQPWVTPAIVYSHSSGQHEKVTQSGIWSSTEFTMANLQMGSHHWSDFLFKKLLHFPRCLFDTSSCWSSHILFSLSLSDWCSNLTLHHNTRSHQVRAYSSPSSTMTNLPVLTHSFSLCVSLFLSWTLSLSMLWTSPTLILLMKYCGGLVLSVLH